MQGKHARDTKKKRLKIPVSFTTTVDGSQNIYTYFSPEDTQLEDIGMFISGANLPEGSMEASLSVGVPNESVKIIYPFVVKPGENKYSNSIKLEKGQVIVLSGAIPVGATVSIFFSVVMEIR